MWQASRQVTGRAAEIDNEKHCMQLAMRNVERPVVLAKTKGRCGVVPGRKAAALKLATAVSALGVFLATTQVETASYTL